MKRSSTYCEGAVFLVPLPTSGFGVGVLVRGDGKGRAFGYFFGPRVEGENQVNIDGLKPATAILTCRFGDHGLFNGRWPIIGHINDWKDNRWVMPGFVRPHDHGSLRFLTEYDDCLRAISERVDALSVSHLPDDAQYGSGVVEKKLGKLLLQ